MAGNLRRDARTRFLCRRDGQLWLGHNDSGEAVVVSPVDGAHESPRAADLAHDDFLPLEELREHRVVQPFRVVVDEPARVPEGIAVGYVLPPDHWLVPRGRWALHSNPRVF